MRVPAHPSAQSRPVAVSIARRRVVLHDVVGAVPGKKYSLVVSVVQAPGSSPVCASMVICSRPSGLAKLATGSFDEISVK
jgi:hypothetical protein